LYIKLVTETSLYYDARSEKHQIICCIFYIIGVTSYNSLLEMPVPQSCSNVDYSSCLSDWTAVSSSSEEIGVTFTEYIRLCLVLLTVGRTQIIWEFTKKRFLKSLTGLYLVIC